MATVLDILGLCLLVYAALHDIAARTVPNTVSILLLAAGICVRGLDHTFLAGLAVTAGAFALLCAIWLAGAMGGGDVKLWSAATALVPPALGPQLAFVSWVVVLGGVLALAYLALFLAFRRAPVQAGAAGGGFLRRVWRAEYWRIRRRAPLPYACAIAGGAFAVLAPPLFSAR